ncbi:hypothetical protein C3O17_22110 [Salmonella enterica subsp. enterica serovar Enteritidis]|nr:hypothetical protein [Salmonella enterica subsp. enterica serovar Enteritidis]EBZ5381782.1 hypothetical protein [Salmonella enterica subsp. enterica serovar Enteritidis]ECA3694632.1 hypothetical protein [Salmonella enterica subsp. enterica serovar Enteritidis]
MMLENVIVPRPFQAGLIINVPKSNADTAVCLHVLPMMIKQVLQYEFIPSGTTYLTRSRQRRTHYAHPRCVRPRHRR